MRHGSIVLAGVIAVAMAGVAGAQQQSNGELGPAVLSSSGAQSAAGCRQAAANNQRGNVYGGKMMSSNYNTPAGKNGYTSRLCGVPYGTAARSGGGPGVDAHAGLVHRN